MYQTQTCAHTLIQIAGDERIAACVSNKTWLALRYTAVMDLNQSMTTTHRHTQSHTDTNTHIHTWEQKTGTGNHPPPRPPICTSVTAGSNTCSTQSPMSHLRSCPIVCCCPLHTHTHTHAQTEDPMTYNLWTGRVQVTSQSVSHENDRHVTFTLCLGSGRLSDGNDYR